MIKVAKDLLTGILKNQKVNQIHWGEDAFGRIKINPAAIILAQKEELEERRRKAVKWTDTVTGQKYLRRQIYKRILPIEVNLFHKTEEQVDELIKGLLANLPKGIDDGKGNYTAIEPKGIDWPPDQKERALAVVFLQFIGGIYKDEPITTYTTVQTNLTIAKGV